MTPEKLIKREAKENLKGNMPAAIGVALTVMVSFMAVIYLSSTLSSFIALLIQNNNSNFINDNPLFILGLYFFLAITGFVFTLPLVMGLVRFSYLVAKDRYCHYSQVFYYLKKDRFFASLGFYLKLIFKNFWQAVISFLPGLICLMSAAASSANKEQLEFIDNIWYYISYALIYAGIILFSYLSENSFLAIYYYIEEKISFTNLHFVISQIQMTRCRKSYLRLNISLLPCMLSCILVIPCLFTIPYITVTQATSAKWIIALSDKDE